MHKKYVKKGNKTTKNKRIRTILVLLILIVGIIYFANNSKKQINRIANLEHALGESGVELKSLVQGFISNSFLDGDYTVKVKEEIYDVEVINYYNDVVYSLEEGETSKTISLGDNSTEYKTLVVKYHGDLIINEGVTLTATSVNDLTYKKGMYICVLGNLVNNGTITMTARGTYNCPGQNVYLWQNADGTYEYVPAVGGAGGEKNTYTWKSTSSVSVPIAGNEGENGTNRATGGGGSGAIWACLDSYSSGTVSSGAGAAGTSYSGGSGGGSINTNYQGPLSASDGVPNGGKGGDAASARGKAGWVVRTAGGGAGNLGGYGKNTTSGKTIGINDTTYSGEKGTGGLLIIYANTLTNNSTGVIKSNGSRGGSSGVAGGSSGGGSVNIFANLENSGTIEAKGGVLVSGNANEKGAANGGAGGDGSVTITETGNSGIGYLDKYILMSPGDTYKIEENKVFSWGEDSIKSLSYQIADTSIATLESTVIIKANQIGKTTLTITNAVTGNSTTAVIEVSNSAISKPNAPTISAGMIPIKWDGSYWQVIEPNTDTSWYDYASGKPAYMMLNDGVYQSELIRDMTNKKIAKSGTQIKQEELGSIYMWIPRYAYSKLGNIGYIKQENNIVDNWTMPDIFTYETESVDFSLAGIWVECNPLASEAEVTTKINNMNIEENAYGFIANTVGVDAHIDPQIQETIEKFLAGFYMADNPIKDAQNTNRTILKIYDTAKKEPIKAKVTYNDGKVTVEVIYFKYGINKVVNADGKELIQKDTHTYELADLKDMTYTYTITDNQGNVKELKLENIYIIPDAETLCAFRDEVNAGNNFAGATVIQIADIDMSSVCSKELGSWTPIGATENYFAGTYDGNYNTISNLYINTNKCRYLGMFTITEKTTVVKKCVLQNLYMKNTYNEGNRSHTGGIVGYNSGTIEECGIDSGSITAIVTYSSENYEGVNAGGIVALNVPEYGTIIKCYNKADIYGECLTDKYPCVLIGGIIGTMYSNSKVIDCYNTGNITYKCDPAYTYTGGINAWMNLTGTTNATVNNCYNIGSLQNAKKYTRWNYWKSPRKLFGKCTKQLLFTRTNKL